MRLFSVQFIKLERARKTLYYQLIKAVIPVINIRVFNYKFIGKIGLSRHCIIGLSVYLGSLFKASPVIVKTSHRFLTCLITSAFLFTNGTDSEQTVSLHKGVTDI
jgi:hypothetical protein